MWLMYVTKIDFAYEAEQLFSESEQSPTVADYCRKRRADVLRPGIPSLLIARESKIFKVNTERDEEFIPAVSYIEYLKTDGDWWIS